MEKAMAKLIPNVVMMYSLKSKYDKVIQDRDKTIKTCLPIRNGILGSV